MIQSEVLVVAAHWLLVASAWTLALGWAWQWLQWRRNFPRVADLTKLELSAIPPLRGRIPHLTVVVPACNEEQAIAATLRSLLASTGLRLQIVAVDDRSTDATGARMEGVAAQVPADSPHSLQVISIRELPEGWLGKPHAMVAGAALAQADWILFTDGDVLFSPQALARALSHAVAERADHLVVMPDWVTGTWGEAAMHGALHALSTWTLRLWRVSDPTARDFLGVGAFNLMRRDAYEALGGFAALRMEVLEDLRLGWMVKRAGLRQRVAIGRGLVQVRWAQGAWGVVRNLEKNLFALYRYRVLVMLLACGGVAVQMLLPLAALVAGGWAAVAALTLYVAVAGVYAGSRMATQVPAWYALLFPLATGLFLFAMLRSMVLALARGGVAWRGTVYSLRELRAHAGRFW